MDKETRNLVQRATQDARRLLEREYREQLEGLYDVLPDTGEIADAPGNHLDANGRFIRSRIVAAIERERSKVADKEAVFAYLREAAFTTLNRFAALKLMEARRIIQECVSKGDQSAGFREFCGLAPGLIELPDRGYRLYLECVFDEIGTEVGVLFDRRHPAGLLWPRRPALLELLDIFNRRELTENQVWAQDETIGWIYQYFNSDEDRERARYDQQGKPKPPGNSYELAVRNQFFTPRFVVQFLTDNSLGRIWYEMTQGQTRLATDCSYLVRRPREVFLGNPQVISALESAAGWVQKVATSADFQLLPEEARLDEIGDLALLIDGNTLSLREGLGDLAGWFLSRFEGFIERAEPLPQDPVHLWLVLFGCQQFRLRAGCWREADHARILEAAYRALREALIRPEPDELSQKELLGRAVFVPYRRMKDPREILMLDPACGSMHFGLYAFDLLEVIYDEALDPRWNMREQLLASSGWWRYSDSTFDHTTVHLKPVPTPRSSYCRKEVPWEDAHVVIVSASDHADGVEVGKPYIVDSATKFRVPCSHRVSLAQFDYQKALVDGWFSAKMGEAFVRESGCFDFDPPPVPECDAEVAFRRQIPRLIIERNLHGIDIDPRAAQIAAFSLWLRAQKSWQMTGVPTIERFGVRKSNVVCAEPMPGDKGLLREFTATLENPVVGKFGYAAAIVISAFPRQTAKGSAHRFVPNSLHTSKLTAQADPDAKPF